MLHSLRMTARGGAAAVTTLLAATIGSWTTAWAVDPQVLQEESRRVDVIREMEPSVVAIFAKDGNGGGSGVVVSPDGFVVTNFHVVMGQGNFLKCGLNDGKLYDSVLVGVDPTGDVAVIKLV